MKPNICNLYKLFDDRIVIIIKKLDEVLNIKKELTVILEIGDQFQI